MNWNANCQNACEVNYKCYAEDKEDCGFYDKNDKNDCRYKEGAICNNSYANNRSLTSEVLKHLTYYPYLLQNIESKIFREINNAKKEIENNIKKEN